MMRPAMMAAAVLVLAPLPACQGVGGQEQAASQEQALAIIEQHCGAEPDVDSFVNCYARLVATARLQVDCERFLLGLPLSTLSAAADYKMRYGVMPPGLEGRCGSSAFEAYRAAALRDAEAAKRKAGY